MIKKVSSSLSIKIFLITSALLAVACALTYCFIAWFMPLSYTEDLSKDLDKKAQKLAQELEKTSLENCGDILDRFIIETGADIRILDAHANSVPLPSHYTVNHYYMNNDIFVKKISIKTGTQEESGKINNAAEAIQYMGDSSDINLTGKDNVGVEVSSTKVYTQRESIINNIAIATVTSKDYAIAFSGSNNYPFAFSGSKEPYSLVVTGDVQMVNQATEALERTLPWLIVTITCISLFGSLFYSRYVTRPIVKLSGISQKMSDLDLDWYYADNRNDEIGVLYRNLNELSQRLSKALSELRQVNMELKSDIDRERELEHKRMQFFSAVSHELKTPITIIKGQLEGMLQQVGVYKDREKYLARALTVTGKMEALAHELLTISRMESSGFSLHKEKFDFSELVHKHLAEHGELLEQKNLILKTDIDKNIPLVADLAMLNKVLANLISNAVHYSPENQSVYIKVQAEEDGVCFSIENTGAHIAEDALPHLFEAFYRVEQSRNRQTGGSGLGLYIVKMVLEQHGADYKIENTPAGVRFTFRLQ